MMMNERQQYAKDACSITGTYRYGIKLSNGTVAGFALAEEIERDRAI